MKKKKIISLALTLMVMLTSLSGCNQIPPEELSLDTENTTSTAASDTTENTSAPETTTAAETTASVAAAQTEPQTETDEEIGEPTTENITTTEIITEEESTTAAETEKTPVSAEETAPAETTNAPTVETAAVTEKNEETNMLKDNLTVRAGNLLSLEQISAKTMSDDYIDSQLQFSLEMFKKSCAESDGKNMLVSPLSALPALAMTANGAKGETLTEFERVICGGMNLDEFNSLLSAYIKALPSGKNFKLNLADSVWIKDDEKLKVEESFLKTNESLFDAQIFREPFNSATVKKINDWVDENTDGMIEKIVDQLDAETVMCLVNALSFDAKWNTPYDSSYDVSSGNFTLTNGNVRRAEMMYSTENVYLRGTNAVGFMKPYKGGKYSFAAILPDTGITPLEYVESLSVDELKKLLNESERCAVDTKMPKFEFDYDIQLDSVLKDMGVNRAFDAENADFSGIGRIEGENLYISSVLQKTFIAVDEDGTKAGASTMVTVAAGTTAVQPEKKKVYLDRPFVFMIVDNENNLPIFMGCVEEI